MQYHLKLIARYLNELPQLDGHILEAYRDYTKIPAYPALWITPFNAPCAHTISGGQIIQPTLRFSIYIYVKRSGSQILEELYELENLIIRKLYYKRTIDCDLYRLKLLYIDYGSPLHFYGHYSTIKPPHGVERMDWELPFYKFVN